MNEPLIYSIVRKFDNLPSAERIVLVQPQKGFVTAIDLFDPTPRVDFYLCIPFNFTRESIAIEKRKKEHCINTIQEGSCL